MTDGIEYALMGDRRFRYEYIAKSQPVLFACEEAFSRRHESRVLRSCKEESHSSCSHRHWKSAQLCGET